MSHKGMGLTAIVDADDRVLGVFTDGDLRRVLDQGIDVREVRVDAVMTRGGKTARADQLDAEAVALMEQYKITARMLEDYAGHIRGEIGRASGWENVCQ